jgi:hypothetical protein
LTVAREAPKLVAQVKMASRDQVRRRPGRERVGAFASAMLAAMGLAAGCSEVIAPEGGELVTSVGCANNITGDTSILDWELDVTPGTIESGEPFRASLDGVAVFEEDFLDAAQAPLGGVREANLIELNATVHVRSGATGEDVALTVDDSFVDYECFVGRNSCDPANDLEGVPGARPNTDCQPQEETNPCGRFVQFPISTECGPGGACEELNKTGDGSQCDLNDFCITGDLRIQLGEDTGRYTAASEGEVIFGWAEGESTGATIQEEGPNEGTWIIPQPDSNFEDPAGPLTLRVLVKGNRIPVELHCTMGVDSRGPCGVDSAAFLSSPTPNECLPSFLIQPPQ